MNKQPERMADRIELASRETITQALKENNRWMTLLTRRRGLDNKGKRSGVMKLSQVNVMGWSFMSQEFKLQKSLAGWYKVLLERDVLYEGLNQDLAIKHYNGEFHGTTV